MVPHGTVEQKILEVLVWDQADGLLITVVGIPDPAKGEALVLLPIREVTVEILREKLLLAGLPNLWIPKVVCRVERIPILGTGKPTSRAAVSLRSN